MCLISDWISCYITQVSYCETREGNVICVALIVLVMYLHCVDVSCCNHWSCVVLSQNDVTEHCVAIRKGHEILEQAALVMCDWMNFQLLFLRVHLLLFDSSNSPFAGMLYKCLLKEKKVINERAVMGVCCFSSRVHLTSVSADFY